MSTRCQIGFYERDAKRLNDFEALIYKHCTGYPDTEEGVLETIIPILQDFDNNRGLDDVEYAAAWLVAKLKVHYLDIGICRQFHADIEYFYAIHPGRIDIYETPFDTQWQEWKLIRSVPLYSKKEVERILRQSAG